MYDQFVPGIILYLAEFLLIRQGKKDRYIPCTVNEERNSGKLVHSYRHRSLLFSVLWLLFYSYCMNVYDIDCQIIFQEDMKPTHWTEKKKDGAFPKSVCSYHKTREELQGHAAICMRELEAEGPWQQYHLRVWMDQTLGDNEEKSPHDELRGNTTIWGEGNRRRSQDSLSSAPPSFCLHKQCSRWYVRLGLTKEKAERKQEAVSTIPPRKMQWACGIYRSCWNSSHLFLIFQYPVPKSQPQQPQWPQQPCAQCMNTFWH